MRNEDVPSTATVFTPPELAIAMVRAARGSKSATWLDPCVGEGAFTRSMELLGIKKHRIIAIDISRSTAGADCLSQTLRGTDFIRWADTHRDTVDHVVMNPPYVSLSRVSGDPLLTALGVRDSYGAGVTKRSNYWCPFVLRAITTLRDGGSLVAVLPASWDYADYAAIAREEVYRSFGKVYVIRSTKPLFPRVKEGSVIVVGHGRGEPQSTISRIEVAGIDQTIELLQRIAEGNGLNSASTLTSISGSMPQRTRIDQIVDLKIGAVTGDSKYFVLSEDQRKEWKLPLSSVQPVLSKGRHLFSSSMDKSSWSKLRDAGERVWLFRPTASSLRSKYVQAYLRAGSSGLCNCTAYKISSRDSWYITPLPKKGDGFISGMSRHMPFFVMAKMRRITATNTLYIVRFRRRQTVAEMATFGLLLLTTGVRRDIQLRARVYADGLLKYEPSDIGSVRIPIVPAHSDAPKLLEEATRFLVSGNHKEASAIADRWLASVVTPPARGRLPSAKAKRHNAG